MWNTDTEERPEPQECDGCGEPATVSTDIGGGVAWWCKACSEEADDRAIAAYEARLEGLAELP